MLSVELDNLIYAIDSKKEPLTVDFVKALLINLKSCRDTARALEETIVIRTYRREDVEMDLEQADAQGS